MRRISSAGRARAGMLLMTQVDLDQAGPATTSGAVAFGDVIGAMP